MKYSGLGIIIISIALSKVCSCTNGAGHKPSFCAGLAGILEKNSPKWHVHPQVTLSHSQLPSALSALPPHLGEQQILWLMKKVADLPRFPQGVFYNPFNSETGIWSLYMPVENHQAHEHPREKRSQWASAISSDGQQGTPHRRNAGSSNSRWNGQRDAQELW